MTYMKTLVSRYLASGELLSADEKEAIELSKADTIVSFLPRGYDMHTNLFQSLRFFVTAYALILHFFFIFYFLLFSTINMK